MYTRFQSATKTYTMHNAGSWGHIPRDTPGARFLMYLGSAFQEEITEPRKSLLSNARLLNAYLQQNLDVLPYRYSYEIRLLGRSDMVSKGSGGASGFQISGQPYSITCGNGECYLTKLIPGVCVPFAERIDVRREKRIPTDDCGDIKINRKKISYTLPERLTACIEFLESVSDQQIVLYSYESLKPDFSEVENIVAFPAQPRNDSHRDSHVCEESHE